MFRSITFFCLVLYVNSAILGEWNDPNRDAYEPAKGRECGEEEEGEPGIKWFVDSYREKVYPFYYLGCGGDGNAYASAVIAEQNLPKESAQCDGFNMTGWPKYDENDENAPKCPEGSKYVPYGEVSAICCDEATAARYRLAKQDKCPAGEHPLTHEVTYTNSDGEVESQENRTMWGKSCSHTFCPDGYTCHKNEFLAFCCPELPTPGPSEEESTHSQNESFAGAQASGLVDDGVFVSLYVVLIIVFAVILLIALYVCLRHRSKRIPVKFNDESSALNP